MRSLWNITPFLIALTATATCAAQRQDSLTVSASAWASAATNSKLRPQLSYSNEWGRYAQYDQAEVATGFDAAYTHTFRNPEVRFKAGVAAQVSSDRLRTMLHELYADFDLWMFGIRMGLEDYTPVESNTSLSVGSYLMSNNARPLPRVWAGLLDYWSLPLGKLPVPFAKYIKDLIQLRGGASFGWMNDDGCDNFTDDALLHEKFVYARVGALPVKPYAGLYHSVIMGGSMPDGAKIPVDFWASVLGKNGSVEKFGGGVFRGETTNAAGAHQGMWDFGLDLDFEPFCGKLYYQRPFADAQAKNPTQYGINDFTAGLLLTLRHCEVVKEVALEYANTKWEGDEGFPDPCVPNQQGGKTYLFPGDWDTDRIPYLKEHVFLPADVERWEAANGKIDNYQSLKKFLEETYNHGLVYGGRTLYLTNYCAPQGWTRGGLSMGNAIMHTRKTVSRYAPEGTMTLRQTFPNMRVRAVNVGVSGDIVPRRLAYSLRVTASRNYGNFREKYTGPDPSSSWTLKENYFFSRPKNETYTKLDLDITLRHGLTLRTCWAYDFGDLYHSFAARMGVRYALCLPHREAGAGR